ncbi:MAG: hypothetical protein RL662_2095 [Bacteroidota bacterium]
MAKKSRKSKKTEKKATDTMISMPVANPNAAGIDLGSKSHYVCVAQDNVKEFGVFTADLHAIARHLQEYEVKTVVMESTGFYWEQLYLLLLDYDFEVFLVNAKYVKNVKGHKTDVVDSKWLQLLHSLGILSNSFLPDAFTHEVRTYARHRKRLITSASRYLSKMNKILVLMNLHLSIVISDIAGVSGMKVINAIISGETKPEALEKLVGLTVKADRKDILNALTGDFRAEYIFELRHALELYNFYLSKVAETDLEIQTLLDARVKEKPNVKCKKTKKNRNDPSFDVVQYFARETGVNIEEVEGIGPSLILTFASEIGTDLSKFPTAKHLASFIGVAPNRRVTGGKEISSHTPKNSSNIKVAFRQAANSAGNSYGKLGDFFRRIAFRTNRQAAITATARKMAVIVWNMITKGEKYCYEYREGELEYVRQKRVKNLIKSVKENGITLEEIASAFS